MVNSGKEISFTFFFLKKRKTDQGGNSSIYMTITIEKKASILATGKQRAEPTGLMAR